MVCNHHTLAMGHGRTHLCWVGMRSPHQNVQLLLIGFWKLIPLVVWWELPTQWVPEWRGRRGERGGEGEGWIVGGEERRGRRGRRGERGGEGEGWIVGGEERRGEMGGEGEG